MGRGCKLSEQEQESSHPNQEKTHPISDVLFLG